MKNNGLLKRVGALGFPLVGSEEETNADLTLAEMVESKDLRLWEGFPVVLANSAEKGLFNYEKLKRYLEKSFAKPYLASLLVMSLALYKFFNLKFSWTAELHRLLSDKSKKEFSEHLKKLKDEAELNVAGHKMPARRLKTVFNNYFNQTQNKLNELLAIKDELGLEYALSQVFSPKQKELFFKKLKGERLTKTEREYFSRAVKKKLLALANPELHRLSRKILE